MSKSGRSNYLDHPMSVNKKCASSSAKSSLSRSSDFLNIAYLGLVIITSISALYNLAIVGMVLVLKTNDSFRPILWLYLVGLLLFFTSFLVPRRIGWVFLCIFLLLNQVAVLQTTFHDQ